MKRRDFLAVSTLAAGSMTLRSHHTVVAQESPQAGQEDALQLALIGVGNQGRILLNAARQIPQVRVRALCDIWKYARDYGQRLLARYGQQVTTYADYREMLSKEPALDAVLIATPDFAHWPQVRACLDQGLHVYCEPMLAHTLDATRDIVRAVQQSGKLLQVGFQRRSNPRYLHVRQHLLQEARLPGTMTAVQTQWAQEVADLRGWPRSFPMPDSELQPFGYRDMTEFRNWMWYPQFCGGPFCSYVTQQLDICHWFLGASPHFVLASGGRDFYTDRVHPDTMMSVFEFPGSGTEDPRRALRASCNLFTTTSAGGMRQFERFLGTEGSIQISENPHWTRIGREASAGDWDQWVRHDYLVKPDIEPAHAAGSDAIEVQVSGELELFQLPPIPTEYGCTPHLANFVAAIRQESELACPADAAWPSHVAAFKAVEAAETRQSLTLSAEDYRL